MVGALGGVALRRAPAAHAEARLETTRLRLLAASSGICVFPMYVAEELFRAEGFTDVQYSEVAAGEPRLRGLATGVFDLDATFVGPLLHSIDAGDPVVVIAGLHAGCFELFAGDHVRSIRDLKGRKVAVSAVGGPDHAFIASMLAHVGLDARKDVRWVEVAPAEAIARFASGAVDAFMGFPPVPQELRSKRIGRVIVNSASDRPWSQYFCCLVAANRKFAQTHPVATKRALRAIVKAVELCALAPERAALVAPRGFNVRPELVLQTLKEIPYARWGDFDAADSMRFYALRMHESGLVKSSPQKILTQGADWRFIKELRKELKS
jgi:NitT/TauT family transport system substrate-binding protein